MTETYDYHAMSARLTALRAGLLGQFPFFGRLLLHLQFGYAPCGTAYTDMRKVIFDPAFLSALSDEEARFVLLHEVMHCVLHHCTRGRGLQQGAYNIACDIVVNSLILEILNANSFFVHGAPAMHLAPDGKEGREYSAEQVYEMLLPPPENGLPQTGGGTPTANGGQAEDDASAEDTAIFRDEHGPWEDIGDGIIEDDLWEEHIRDAAKSVDAWSGIPLGLRRYLKEVAQTPTMNWRQILHDFIQHDRSDFVFEQPDRRYQGDILLPSFQEQIYGDRVEKLWFLADSSGSVTDEELAVIFGQIRQAIEQIGSLSGELAFFDSEVYPFIPFETMEDLESAVPVGGGGTSFRAIFEKLEERCSYDDPPTAIIILTDGFAPFPAEDAAMGVPVLWIITEDGAQPPWGVCVRL